MKQFISPEEPDGSGRVVLHGKDRRYLAVVRRVRRGDTVTLRLPSGKVALFRVENATAAALVLRLEEESAAPPPAGPKITLFQAMPKGARADRIVREAAECGVCEIVPFDAEYSTRRLAGREGGAQKERWERIIREARQQSGSPEETRVLPPVRFEEVFAVWDSLRAGDGRPATGLFAHPPPPGLAQGTLHGYLKGTPGLIALAVGPEGGFSETEAREFVRHDFKPLALGNTILRCETAALYAVAAVRVLLLEKDSWIHRTKE